MLVEAVVHCRDVDRYVGVVCRDAADALGGRDEAHEDDAARALVLEHGECCRRTAARGEHGVRYDECAILDAARELCIVLDGGKCLGVAIEPDVSDARRGDEVQDAVEHPEACAQDGDDAEFFAREHFCMAVCDRGLDLHVAQGEVARDLVCHEHGDLREQFAEFLCPRFLAAHDGQFVLDERMIDEVECRYVGRTECVSHGMFPFHGEVSSLRDVHRSDIFCRVHRRGGVPLRGGSRLSVHRGRAR